jgi:cation transport ATPase
MHFISRLALLLIAGFLLIATQVWAGSTLEWLFVAGGAAMILGAGIDALRRDRMQMALNGVIGVVGAWTVIEALIFAGTTLEWVSFACAAGLAALAVVGLTLHEMHTERVVHELGVPSREHQSIAA